MSTCPANINHVSWSVFYIQFGPDIRNFCLICSQFFFKNWVILYFFKLRPNLIFIQMLYWYFFKIHIFIKYFLFKVKVGLKLELKF